MSTGWAQSVVTNCATLNGYGEVPLKHGGFTISNLL